MTKKFVIKGSKKYIKKFVKNLLEKVTKISNKEEESDEYYRKNKRNV